MLKTAFSLVLQLEINYLYKFVINSPMVRTILSML